MKFVLLVGWTMFQTWMLMLALGMLAGYLAVPGLAIGFWATLGLGTLFSVAFGTKVSEAIAS